LCYGGRLHCYELCRRLAERHELLLVAERECEVPEPPLPFIYQVARQRRLLTAPVPFTNIPPLSRVEQYFGIDPVFTQQIVSFVARWRPDVVIGMNYQSLAYLARMTGVPTICDLQDDETLHRFRELLHGRATSKWQDLKSLAAIWLYQRRLIPRVTAVTVLSDTDARFCRWHTRHPRVECIPHGVDCDHYQPVAGNENDDRIIFWGSLSFGPNISAILFFAEKVWPLVLWARPQARWSIIGRGDSPLLAPVRKLPGVDFLGYVEDIRPHAAQSAVAVVPMVSGAGIKNKIMEAWAMAMPVVCTPLALGDLPGRPRENVWAAQSPRGLAEGVLALMADRQLRRNMGSAARQTALKYCSWDRAAQAFEALCLDVAGLPHATIEDAGPVPIHASQEAQVLHAGSH
jgi:glycosyltransferase involved in cell wall biosynthesis